jgi:6-phosphogluconolactonase
MMILKIKFQFLLSICFLIASLHVIAQNKLPIKLNVLVGTYTNTGKSEGLYYYSFDSQKGIATLLNKQPIEDPSFLTTGFNNQFIYSVNELGNKLGGITALKLDKNTGEMIKINSEFTQGDHPCHVAIDSKNRYVIVSNYSGGNFKAIQVNKDGSLDTINTQLIQHSGKSINAARQEKPHVHSAIFSPDEDYLLLQDLGTDQISVYDINLSKSNNPISLKPNSIFNTVPGSGPRHLTFHPKKSIAYSVQELNGTVNVMKFKNGKLSLMQDISMTNPNETRKNGAADIHISPDGKYLYASNRGEFNELVIFRIIADGTLSYVATQSTLGKGPRNFSIDPSGNFLLVANQLTDEIVVFKRDQNSGLLSDTKNRIKVGAPVCIKFITN